MLRLFIFCLALFCFGCSSNTSTEEDTGDTYENFSGLFKNASLPFQLSDTFLLKNKDTVSLKGANYSSFLADSTISKVFSKGAKVKYVPLWKIDLPEGDHYFIVKAEAARKKTAFLLVFDKENQVQASFPFLIPDADESTNQVTVVDKAFSVSKNIVRKKPNDVTAEGKDVYAWDKAMKSFVLVMTDPLDEKSLELVNPIDTLAKTHKLAGDYSKDKKNIVSIRDGRKPNLLTVFIHIDNGADCSGEVKGDVTITSPTTAIYQQGGDPCILQLNFSGNTVRLSEVEGCGSRRGLNCSFDGSFTRKKQAAPKNTKGTKKNLKKKAGT
jgi:hypothetical protein